MDGNYGGFLCTNGASFSYCPPGYYCLSESPILPIISPSGYSASIGQNHPVSCLPLSICPQGTETETGLLLVILFLIITVLMILINYLLPYYNLMTAKRENLNGNNNENGVIQGKDTLFIQIGAENEMKSMKNMSVEEDNTQVKFHFEEKEIEFNNNNNNNNNHSTELDRSLKGSAANGILKAENISVTIKSFSNAKKNKNGEEKSTIQEKLILNDVSVEFCSGELSCIMGPSGSSKTTLLNVLAGKINNYQGNIHYRENNISKKLPRIGFAPQSDTLLPMLTVDQLLIHCASMYLPVNTTHEQILANVKRVKNLLNLNNLGSVRIGDEYRHKTLSGGERKRVSIASELVTNPNILLLDEPFSGLDSTTSLDIAQSLQKIASQGCIIICVIHQPRFELFSQFDKVILLESGNLIYSGSVHLIEKFYALNGFPSPPFINPADWYIDNIYSIHSEISKQNVVNKNNNININSNKSIVVSANEQQQQQEILQASSSPDKMKVFWMQLFFIMKLNLLIDLGTLKQVFWDSILQLLPGLALGLASSGNPNYSPVLPLSIANMCPLLIRDRCINMAASNSFISLSFYLTMVGALFGVVYSVRRFGRDAEAFKRQVQSGMNLWAYFIAGILYDLIHIVRCSLIFLAFYWILAGPRGTLNGWFWLMFTLYWCGFGVGYVSSLLFVYNRATAIGVVITISVSVTSGLYPVLSVTNSWPVLNWFWYISYNRWIAEGFIDLSYSGGPNPDRIESIVNYTGFTYNRFTVDIIIAFIIGIAWRIAALLLLLHKYKSKPKH